MLCDGHFMLAGIWRRYAARNYILECRLSSPGVGRGTDGWLVVSLQMAGYI
jgi:hypothetical protein